jgi:PAS domain S-box-containing protein
MASKKILVTEDVPSIALYLDGLLKHLGYEVCPIASSGEEALRIVREQKPDLVLMDIQLQGPMDGIQTAEAINSAQGPPVIYLTENADEKTLARAKATIPASCLLKPLKERELQIGIEMALVNDALRRELREAHSLLEARVKQRTEKLAMVNECLNEEIRMRQNAETKAMEQAALLDKARDAIFLRTIDGVVLYWNQSAERLYGFSRAETIGRRIGDLTSEVHDEHVESALRTVTATGEWIGELKHLSRTGTAIVVESRWTLVRDSTAILVVNTEITERKRIEEQFLRAQRLESIGALASGIAHDLNNVFAPLLMAAQLLQETNPEGETRLADTIFASAARGADMVKQILTFVRGGDGVKGPIQLEHLVREIKNLLSDTLPKSIRIKTQFSTRLWPVMGEATPLHQLLMNLCVNARDAMPQGGELTITLSNVVADEVFVRTRSDARPGPYLCLSVKDTGSGMSPEVRKNIFQPFFTTKEPGKGTGLGLSTVQAIVREHDGFVELDSEPGIGTEFRVYLPACGQAAAAGSAQEAEFPRGDGQLILVADDERAVRDIIAATLEAYGFRVIVADDGVDALSLFAVQRDKIAGVITDLSMPYLDGLACARALRKLAPAIPILMISGTGFESGEGMRIDNEETELLLKPFTKASLLTALHKVLGKSTASAR